MEEKRTSTQCGNVVLMFLIGVVGALVVGWWVFPSLLYSEMQQPIRFSHKVHVEEQAMACEDCHFFNEDGSFAGLPSTETCADCHSDLMGEDPDEAKFVEQYVNEEKEVPWLIYQFQPDNVYFSHNAHQDFECTDCHPPLAENDTPPAYYRNRISGYSKQTMKMWQCERCHAEKHVSNACYQCHK